MFENSDYYLRESNSKNLSDENGIKTAAGAKKNFLIFIHKFNDKNK